jgi:hypothetical protein
LRVNRQTNRGKRRRNAEASRQTVERWGHAAFYERHANCV